jgi:nucleoside-diphosphate-sugar epimerase
MRILLAGATGVIGRPLLTLLVRAGHDVTGTTRSAARVGAIAASGAVPAVVDVFDEDGLREAARVARPEVVIHQLTNLPDEADPTKIAASLAANARIRIEGTRQSHHRSQGGRRTAHGRPEHRLHVRARAGAARRDRRPNAGR